MMPYVRGPGSPDWVPVAEDEPPALWGVWILPEGGALLRARRYGRELQKAIPPNGTVSALHAAALVYRRDPDTGDPRPVTRLTIYDWVNDGVRGRKLPRVRRAVRPNVRPVLHIRLTDLRAFAAYAGYEVLPSDKAERRRYHQLLTRG